MPTFSYTLPDGMENDSVMKDLKKELKKIDIVMGEVHNKGNLFTAVYEHENGNYTNGMKRKLKACLDEYAEKAGIEIIS